MQITIVVCYNAGRGDRQMLKEESNYFRELIRVLVRNLGILERSEASCCGVTLSQCRALVEVGRAGEVSLNELAEALSLDKSTMSRTINNLVEAELVIRELHAEDRRYVTIKLTDKGIGAFKNIEESMEQYYETLLFSILENKRVQVLESLQLIVDAAKENKCCR